MKKIKKVILCNIGRIQQDFEYIFPNIEIVKYLSEDKNIKELNKKEVITFDDLKKNNKTMIIICDRKEKKYESYFNKINYEEGKNYVYLEDYATVLDEPESPKMNFLKEKFWYNNFHPKKSNSEMLKDMIYTDSRYDFDCIMPFNYVQIQTYGFVYPCCQGWAKYNIGNIFFDSPKKVWNSTTAKLYRLSVINKTYAFCEPNNCPYLSNPHQVNKRETCHYVKERPDSVCLAYDYTCNLMCKSCRNERMNHNNNKDYQVMYNDIVKKLHKYNWLDAKELYVASQGEAMLGKSYRKILFSDKTNRKSIIIHTNGTLLNKANLDKLTSKYSDISLFISLDACTKKTYETLRKGGNFDILMKNLIYISELKKEGKINYVSILYVVQRENYAELAETCKLAISLGFDRLDATRIFNWGTYSEEEFKNVSMFDENGEANKELQKILEDSIFKTKKIEISGNIFK